REQDRPHAFGVPVAAELGDERLGERRRQGIGPGRIVEGQADQVAVALDPERRAHGSSSSGTSISIASSPWPCVLPWASVSSDAVPPPPSESWSRKLSASRFGTSKRSTAPRQTSRKCSRTRSAVTSRRITS